LPGAIDRGPEAKPVVGEVAHRRINRRHTGAAIDGAFADIAARVHPQAQENGRSTRPAVERLAREIATAQDGARQMRGFRHAIVPASSRAVSASAAARARSDAARARAGTAHVRRPLRRLGALARGLGGRDFLHGRRFDLRLGRDDRRGFAFDVLGRRPPFLLPGLGMLTLQRWWRRRRRLADIEHVKHALGIGEIDLARNVQEREQQQAMHRDHRGDRAALVAPIEI